MHASSQMRLLGQTVLNYAFSQKVQLDLISAFDWKLEPNFYRILRKKWCSYMLCCCWQNGELLKLTHSIWHYDCSLTLMQDQHRILNGSPSISNMLLSYISHGIFLLLYISYSWHNLYRTQRDIDGHDKPKVADIQRKGIMFQKI